MPLQRIRTPMSADIETDLETVGAESESEASASLPDGETGANVPRKRRTDRWRRAVVFGVLPGLAIMLATAAGYTQWRNGAARASQLAGVEAAKVASDGTVAMLSYKPDTVERTLDAARDRMTGKLKDSYLKLTHDVVIPGSKQKQITAVASVPAAAPITASPNHAVVLIFVDQTVTVGADPPTDTASRIRVTLDKVENQWLISGFDPI
jgi:Mce-associated membrane protein